MLGSVNCEKGGVSCWCKCQVSLAAQRGHKEYAEMKNKVFDASEPVGGNEVLKFGAI